MARIRSRNTLIALALAALATALTAVYFGSSGSGDSTASAGADVLVARRDIPVGTPGAELVRQRFVVRTTVDPSQLAPTAVRDEQELGGVVTARTVFAGRQLVTTDVVASHGEPAFAALRGTTRAITLAADPAQLLAGTLRDGDRVDVLASLAYPPGSSNHYSRVVLRGLLVLRAPAGAATTAGTGSTSVTLALSDAQAQKLFYVVKNADWALLLRPALRAADSRLGNDTAATVLGAGR